MAAVTIWKEAFTDIRFKVLAAQCNLSDSAHALGKMAELWQHCTEQYVYVLPESIVTAILGPNGINGIIEAGLGERAEDGIRICGTQGRIEWLQ